MLKEERESVLERALRLNNDRDINRVFKKGQFATGELFRIKYLRNNLSKPRVTVLAGLKFSKKAVIRNLIKRRVRAYIAKTIKNLKDLDIVIMPKNNDPQKFSYANVAKDLEKILSPLFK